MAQMGSGTHVYDVAEGWAKVPENLAFGYTHGIVVDADDNVYVFHTGNPSMFVFDRDGNFLKSWGSQFAGGAHGCYLHDEKDGQFFYLTDTSRGLVVKTTLDGEELLTIGTPDLPDVYNAEKRFIPTDVAVGPNGEIYIADGYGQSWVHEYDGKGGYVRSWGGKGSEPGQLSCPHGISVDYRHEEPELYVADRGNNRIQVFTLDGKHKRFIAHDMKQPDSFYYYNDELYFPDLQSRVTIFDKNDDFITHLGDDDNASSREGWPNIDLSLFQPDKFSSPHGVCVDPSGNVYVAEWTQYGRVTKLVRRKG